MFQAANPELLTPREGGNQELLRIVHGNALSGQYPQHVPTGFSSSSQQPLSSNTAVASAFLHRTCIQDPSCLATVAAGQLQTVFVICVCTTL